MKTKFIYILAFGVLFITSCRKDKDISQPVALSIQLETNPEEVSFDLPLAGAEITLVNKANGAEYKAVSNAGGQYAFSSLAPGTYTISVLLTIDAQLYTERSGNYTDKSVSFSYTMDNVSLLDDTSITAILSLSSQVGDWVFKQIYNYGSNTSQGASFRDVFVEIYNNSNTTLYADSLIFAISYGKANNNTGSYLLDNLQFDWSQSIGMTGPGDANKDYVYAKAVYMIPSNDTGNRYPVAPGKSIILAQTAIDHTKPYVAADGREVGIGDAELTIDLSKADFEAYQYPYEQKTQPGRAQYRFDVDNPDVTDVEVIYSISGNRDMVLNPQGRESFIIFKAPAGKDPNTLPLYAVPTDRDINAETTVYQQIPVSYILDGVEVHHPIATSRLPRRLPVSVDAGFTFAPGGQYSGQSLVRRTKEVFAGRRILQDTNNSSVDFGYLEKADPSKGNSSFID